MQIVIKIPEEIYKASQIIDVKYEDVIQIPLEVIANGTPLDDLLQRLRKRISDLYNTDVAYDNGDYNTMDTPTLDKVLEYFDSEVNM